jgi:hypothetical protein
MNDLDSLLRADARTLLDDGGFSARVVGALPPAAATRPWIGPVLVIGSAAVGSLAAALLAPAGGSLLQGFADLVQLRAFTPAAITALAMSGALLACALVLAFDSE